MTLEEVYLEHILLHLRSNDPDDGLLKTYINSWFAHHRGGPFLNAGRKPRWLSDKSSKRLLVRHLHAVSHAARQAHMDGRIDDLVIDHSIPSAELVRSLKARAFTKRNEVQAFLTKRFTLCLLTKHEHDEVLKPFKSRMTDDWNEESFEAEDALRYCRYQHASTRIAFDVQHQPA